MKNKYAGKCVRCGSRVAEGEGIAERGPDDRWQVRHAGKACGPAEQAGQSAGAQPGEYIGRVDPRNPASVDAAVGDLLGGVLIRGNTYPVRVALRAMGGQWDAGSQAWLVPRDRAEEAQKLVAAQPQKKSKGRSGYGSPRCPSCGGKKPARYPVCWDCKTLEEEDMGYYR